MERKLFSRTFVEGIVSLGKGMVSMFSWASCSPKPFSYEERFGTDAKLLASDWQRVGDDFKNATKQLERKTKSSSK